jgi:hypothetical protein
MIQNLLVYKFFFNLIRHGFCHGDLHAGNIFFSYKFKELTLIDFGAVCEIDLFRGDESTKELLDILIMSVFYNYDDMFDKLTKLLNSRCTETQIDMKSPEYIAFKKLLREIRLSNLIKETKMNAETDSYNNFVFGKGRTNEEYTMEEEKPISKDGIIFDSIYSYLEIKQFEKETVVENKDILTIKYDEQISDVVSFAKILEMIIKFYSKIGVNIAIKFSQFYELQKAYSLLLGVLNNAKYNSLRTTIAMRHAIKTVKHMPKLLEELSITKDIIITYMNERNKKSEFIKQYMKKINHN